MLRRLMLCLMLSPMLGSVHAEPLAEAAVPEPLKPWVGWVLQDQDQRACPLAAGQRLCHWPAELQLTLEAQGGHFALQLQAYAPGSYALPGDADHWPQDVRADGSAVAVVAAGDRPVVRLPAGRHRLEGRWEWSRLPESLRIPAEAGAVRLSLAGRAQPHPLRNGEQLWLGRSEATAGLGNHLALKVFRLLDDELPPRLTTVIEIEAAGEVREENFGAVLPAGWTALALGGPLPARFDEQNQLRVQVRPGLWRVEVEARAGAPLQALRRPASSAPWPEDEVWSLQPHPELRVADTSGAPAIDPRQTQMPEAWHSLPAYLLGADTELRFDERSRGQTQTEPDRLTLQRQLWLDFDGGGYTVQDRLQGQLQTRWRLESQAPVSLGQVLVDGQPQLITRQAEGVGVEVRRGQLDLTADSRIGEGTRRLPAHGWNVDVQELGVTLHLPPAWRLFAAPGADRVPDTWLARWTLLDLLVVLIAAIAAQRLFGWRAGLLTLVTLALIWHEPQAPRWSWINLIAALALLQALPDALRGGALARWLSYYRWVAAGLVVLIAVPFAIQQARLALYPQLEMGGFPGTMQGEADLAVVQSMPAAAPAPVEEYAASDQAGPLVRQLERKAYGGAASVAAVSRQSIQQLDPKALTQTGPGLPQWQWRSVSLGWSGPVTAAQTLRLWLLPPALVRSLQWLSIALVALTLARWLKPDGGFRTPRWPGLKSAAAAPVLALLLMQPWASPQAQAQDASAPPPPPAPELLDQLRERLLAPPGCAPQCIELPRLRVAVEGGRLILRLTVDAAAASALPLPVPFLASGEQTRVWQPLAVQLDGRAADTRRDEQGRLWAAVPAGRHELQIDGSLEGFSLLALPLPQKPRLVAASVGDWQLGGLDDLGRPAEALQLLRPPSADAAGRGEPAQQALPPLWRVSRSLQLGLDWDVSTLVQRIGSTQAAASLSVPLLPGERLTGENLRSRDGAVLLSFAPGQTEARWSSRLPVQDALSLSAAQREDLFETWSFDVSPLWHVDFDGLPAVQLQQNGYRMPAYRPWPGEQLRLAISRPAGIEGQTLTLDRASLSLQPGKRVTDLQLALQLRASQGGVYRLKLPQGLELLGLNVDGQPQTARQENGELVLNLHPGTQQLQLSLREARGAGLLLRTPAVQLGIAGVNAELDVTLPYDRWVLYAGGPRLGPAVLFWGVLAVLLLIGAALGRVPLTPLSSLQWLLLMIGLSQIPVWGAALVVGWLVALGARGRYGDALVLNRFNVLQVLLALWTAAALALLFSAVAKGLLGSPDMQIAGNGSSGNVLRWFQDRHDGELPTAWVLSVSIWIYRLLMLAWALWLASALLGWLRWGWQQFSGGALWKRPPPPPPPSFAPATENAT